MWFTERTSTVCSDSLMDLFLTCLATFSPEISPSETFRQNNYNLTVGTVSWKYFLDLKFTNLAIYFTTDSAIFAIRAVNIFMELWQPKNTPLEIVIRVEALCKFCHKTYESKLLPQSLWFFCDNTQFYL